MIYIVYVQGIEIARFNKNYLADWFVNCLKSGKDELLNKNIWKAIGCNLFQNCEINISAFDTKDM